jgi:hypothetical protein
MDQTFQSCRTFLLTVLVSDTHSRNWRNQAVGGATVSDTMGSGSWQER